MKNKQLGAFALLQAEIEPARGIVLVAHGLNNKPEVMNDIIAVLRSAGFHCMRLSLHDKALKTLTPSDDVVEIWLAGFQEAHAQIVQEYPGTPVYALGYSLGAILNILYVDSLECASEVPFSKMVLIAPPVALTSAASAVRLAKHLGRMRVSVPSAAPRKIRARRGTPIREYSALSSIVSTLSKVQHSDRLNAIHTVIFLDRGDEVVDYTGVIEWLQRNRLESWNVKEIGHREAVDGSYAHFLLAEEALGISAWTNLTEAVVSHFEG